MKLNNREALIDFRSSALDALKSYDCRILFCGGTGCTATGANKIYDEMVALCRDLPGVSVEMPAHVPHAGIVKTGCQGVCELGPLVRIEPHGYQYVKVQLSDCAEIVKETVLLGKPLERLF